MLRNGPIRGAVDRNVNKFSSICDTLLNRTLNLHLLRGRFRLRLPSAVADTQIIRHFKDLTKLQSN